VFQGEGQVAGERVLGRVAGRQDAPFRRGGDPVVAADGMEALWKGAFEAMGLGEPGIAGGTGGLRKAPVLKNGYGL